MFDVMAHNCRVQHRKSIKFDLDTGHVAKYLLLTQLIDGIEGESMCCSNRNYVTNLHVAGAFYSRRMSIGCHKSQVTHLLTSLKMTTRGRGKTSDYHGDNSENQAANQPIADSINFPIFRLGGGTILIGSIAHIS